MKSLYSARAWVFRTIVGLAGLILGSHLVYGDDSFRREPPNREAMRSALQSCGISAPTPGSPPPALNDEQKQCLKDAGFNPPQESGGRRGPRPGGPDAAGFQKLKACFEADNVALPDPRSGQQPNDAQRTQFEKCRAQMTANALSAQ